MKIIELLLLFTACHAIAGDPSLIAFEEHTDRTKYAERYRILVDLDGDGVKDMLLSGNPDEFGRMSYPWAVYLNRKGDFLYVGEVWALSSAIAFEPDKARKSSESKTRRHARIWVYRKSSESNESLGYYSVGEDCVDGFTIYTGDDKATLGKRLYKATFDPSRIPFTMERSRTTESGKVTWAATNR